MKKHYAMVRHGSWSRSCCRWSSASGSALIVLRRSIPKGRGVLPAAAALMDAAPPSRAIARNNAWASRHLRLTDSRRICNSMDRVLPQLAGYLSHVVVVDCFTWTQWRGHTPASGLGEPEALRDRYRAPRSTGHGGPPLARRSRRPECDWTGARGLRASRRCLCPARAEVPAIAAPTPAPGASPWAGQRQPGRLIAASDPAPTSLPGARRRVMAERIRIPALPPQPPWTPTTMFQLLAPPKAQSRAGTRRPAPVLLEPTLRPVR